MKWNDLIHSVCYLDYDWSLLPLHTPDRVGDSQPAKNTPARMIPRHSEKVLYEPYYFSNPLTTYSIFHLFFLLAGLHEYSRDTSMIYSYQAPCSDQFILVVVDVHGRRRARRGWGWAEPSPWMLGTRRVPHPQRGGGPRVPPRLWIHDARLWVMLIGCSKVHVLLHKR